MESDEFIRSILNPVEKVEEKSNSEIIERFSAVPLSDPKQEVEKFGDEIEARLHAKQPERGRTRGVLNKTNEERANIGALARVAGDTSAAEKYGVSVSAAHAYKNGKSTPAGPPLPELAVAIETKIGRVRHAAVDHLETILDIIDKDTLQELRPLEKIKAAMGMANIASRIAPADKSNERTLIIRVPAEQDTLEEYNVIDITPEGHVLPSV